MSGDDDGTKHAHAVMIQRRRVGAGLAMIVVGALFCAFVGWILGLLMVSLALLATAAFVTEALQYRRGRRSI